MTGLRRAFVAVALPPAVLRWAESAANSARAAIGADASLRWTRTDQRHLTLCFIGRVADAAAIAGFVADSVRGRAPFTAVLGGGGAFPVADRGSVLWLGVRDGADELDALAGGLAELAHPGDRPYRAHLTLARVDGPRDLRAVVAVLDAVPASPPWTVDEVVLFESDTRAEGPTHTEQARFGLGA